MSPKMVKLVRKISLEVHFEVKQYTTHNTIYICFIKMFPYNPNICFQFF